MEVDNFMEERYRLVSSQGERLPYDFKRSVWPVYPVTLPWALSWSPLG